MFSFAGMINKRDYLNLFRAPTYQPTFFKILEVYTTNLRRLFTFMDGKNKGIASILGKRHLHLTSRPQSIKQPGKLSASAYVEYLYENPSYSKAPLPSKWNSPLDKNCTACTCALVHCHRLQPRWQSAAYQLEQQVGTYKLHMHVNTQALGSLHRKTAEA